MPLDFIKHITAPGDNDHVALSAYCELTREVASAVLQLDYTYIDEWVSFSAQDDDGNRDRTGISLREFERRYNALEALPNEQGDIASQCTCIGNIPEKTIYVDAGPHTEYVVDNTTHHGDIPDTTALGSSNIEEEQEEENASGGNRTTQYAKYRGGNDPFAIHNNLAAHCRIYLDGFHGPSNDRAKNDRANRTIHAQIRDIRYSLGNSKTVSDLPSMT